MEQKHPINDVLNMTMERLKEMVDVNTVVGKPITTPDGVTVIPISKVSLGFASGGSDFAPKNLPADKANCFGGGSGAGVSVVPVSFLVIHGDNVRIINANPMPDGTVEKAINLVPEVVDKVTAVISEMQSKKKTEEEQAQ
ncbi:MAG: GerW family sporulation protein [Clostridiales bacterium]|nr:GerW family sporulation protein [Clostridiales bacterium]MCD7753755.1 GerW family sporulation protein [Clostridiales bacterium]MCD7880337.1 GerW family sporulation protein [Clostridiales bacterium]MCD8385194.1 GerW family sporulation protein [Clostridiales bacterium]